MSARDKVAGVLSGRWFAPHGHAEARRGLAIGKSWHDEARTLAHSVTDSFTPEQRAAIEADVLRQVADEWEASRIQVTVAGVGAPGLMPVSRLRAEADRIEEEAR